MSHNSRPRYSLVTCTVASHQPYGLAIRSDSGEAGFVDRAEIADNAVPSDGWPAVGEPVVGVVLGYTNDERLRVSARPSDVSLVRSVADPAAALREWAKLQRTFPPDDTARRRFFGAPYAREVLRWALKHPEGTAPHTNALRLLPFAPDELREAITSDEGGNTHANNNRT